MKKVGDEGTAYAAWLLSVGTMITLRKKGILTRIDCTEVLENVTLLIEEDGLDVEKASDAHALLDELREIFSRTE